MLKSIWQTLNNAHDYLCCMSKAPSYPTRVAGIAGWLTFILALAGVYVSAVALVIFALEALAVVIGTAATVGGFVAMLVVGLVLWGAWMLGPNEVKQ